MNDSVTMQNQQDVTTSLKVGGETMAIKQKNMPSIETQKRMHAFFLKTSAPRIWQKEKEAAEKEKAR